MSYRVALEKLWAMGLLYPCTCSRADIKAAANAPQEGAPLVGPDGIVYPGTCRKTPQGSMPLDVALRIDISKALQSIENNDICFNDGEVEYCKTASQMCGEIGDVVLARKDMGASYHLSIVIDDAEQGITDVIRGEDLRDATFIHVLLQRLLDLPTPRYCHHALIRDENGRRLAKRDDARAISKYREDGLTPADVRALVGL